MKGTVRSLVKRSPDEACGSVTPSWKRSQTAAAALGRPGMLAGSAPADCRCAQQLFLQGALTEAPGVPAPGPALGPSKPTKE